MLRVLRDQYQARRKIEVRIFEPRSNVAADQRVSRRILDVRSEVRTGRHRGLPRTVRAQHALFVAAGRIDDVHGERIATVEMPDFIGRLGGQSKPTGQGQLKIDQWSVGSFKTDQ